MNVWFKNLFLNYTYLCNISVISKSQVLPLME